MEAEGVRIVDPIDPVRLLLAFVDGLPNSLLQHLEESLEGRVGLTII